MVYMHGGGFSGGCGHDLLSYEGESLVRHHDVVVVNHNHRLNVFGYLNLAGIGGERYASSANVGLLDLVAVLQWVRENVAQFGGDSGNVTIFGGGGKVISLMALPAAKGLFHRAIIQSGPYLKALSPEYSNRVASNLMTELGLSTTQVNQLQNIPVDRLEGAAAKAIRKMAPRATPPLLRTFGDAGWGPTVDGHILPSHPFDPGAPLISADVPLLTGTNLNEFVSGLDNPTAHSMTADQMRQLLKNSYGDSADAIFDGLPQGLSQGIAIRSICSDCCLQHAPPLVRTGHSQGRTVRRAGLCLCLLVAYLGARRSRRNVSCVRDFVRLR
jgi:para-nitrobenzyl esterase